VLLAGVAGLAAGALRWRRANARFSALSASCSNIRSAWNDVRGISEAEAQGLPRSPAPRACRPAKPIAWQETRRRSGRALDTLAREELGLNPSELGSPWGAAISSLLSFTLGAAIPLLPFLLGAGTQALPVAAALTAVALFAVGATLSLFTGRGALVSGARMLLLGGLAAAVTFGVGHLAGVAVG
jgi:hypothetical protein